MPDYGICNNREMVSHNYVISSLVVFSSRLYQAAKLFLFSPSSGLYSCPLAMTDGAAKTIEVQQYSLWTVLIFLFEIKILL